LQLLKIGALFGSAIIIPSPSAVAERPISRAVARTISGVETSGLCGMMFSEQSADGETASNPCHPLEPALD